MHGSRLVLGHVPVERLAVHQQAFGSALLEREPAMLETELAGVRVRPRPRALQVGTPKEAAASLRARHDRAGPQAHHHHAVGFAHPAPAVADLRQIDTARLERLRARDEVLGTCSRRRRASAARAPWAGVQRIVAYRDDAGLAQALGVGAQLLDILLAQLLDALARPLLRRTALECILAGVHGDSFLSRGESGRRLAGTTIKKGAARSAT